MNSKYFFTIFILMFVSLNKTEAVQSDNYVTDAVKMICPLMKKFNIEPKRHKKMNCKEIVDDFRKSLNNCDTYDNPLCNIVISLPTTTQIFTLMGCLAAGPASIGVCLGTIGLGALSPFLT